MARVIAYPGVPGSFSHAAARDLFPADELVAFDTFEGAAEAVAESRADYALLPVENSFAGVVQASFALMDRLPLHIVGETARRVRHQLLGVKGALLSDIRTISSHPQAIAQCDGFLSRLKDVRLVPSENTALSAQEVARAGDRSHAAIASAEAAEIFGLDVLAADIQTSRTNTTRFVALSLDDKPLGTPNKASVIFTVDNKVGALVQVLISFALSGLNMSHLESRPLPDTPFAYAFWADFEGAMDADHLATAMDAAAHFSRELRLLGIYPKAEIRG